MMLSKLPPDVITNVVEILYYAATVLIGYIARLLQDRKAKSALKEQINVRDKQIDGAMKVIDNLKRTKP